MPRSAIMITKSLRLNLKLVYQLTQRMMIWPSKCRPLNSASIGPKGRILPSSAIGSVCTRAGAAKIGQVAQETGLTIDTIRFYEKQGLLKHSVRTEGGFRLFGSSEIETLKFVRKGQELGFSLGEIRELLIL